jgi:hypothetical protein
LAVRMELAAGIEGLTNLLRTSVRRPYLSVLSFLLYSVHVSFLPYLSTIPGSFTVQICSFSLRFSGVCDTKPRRWIIESRHFDSTYWSRFQGSKSQRRNARFYP